MLRPVVGSVLLALALSAGTTQAFGKLRALDLEEAVDGEISVRDAAETTEVTMGYDTDCKVGEPEVVKECGAGFCSQIVQRSVITAPSGSGRACPALLELRPCTPVDCVMTPWGSWDGCGADGYKFRTRSIVTPPLYGGRACGSPLDKVKCSASDCLVSPWGDWTCNATTGNKIRTREIVREAKPYGGACPSLQETKPCDPIDCELKTVAEDSGVWSLCQFDGISTGYQTKVLGIKTKPLYNGTACPPPTDQSRIAAQPCQLPVPGNSTRKVSAVLDILAYSDVYEMLQDSVNALNIGGPSRVVPIAKQMRANNSNSLVLFSGDSVSPSLWSLQFKGMQMVDAHNAIGVDFASLGNHEFDYGLEAFWNVTAASTFPWLNANCYEKSTGKLLRGTKERAIKEFNHPVYGKLKIGLFGVMYDMKDTTRGLYWTDPIEAAKIQVKELKAENVTMIIALTHQELADDSRLSKEVSGIHLIYGGHDHSSMLQTNFGAPYLKSDFDFRSIWKSHIEYFDKDTNLSNVTMFRMEHKAVPIIQEMPTDLALDAIIANYKVQIDVMFSRVVGTLCERLDLTSATVRTKDTSVAHTYTDALLAFYGPGAADAVVQNGGAIRPDKFLEVGNLTFGDLEAWSPFGNTILIVQTDGASLKKFIKREMVGSCGNNVIVTNGVYVHTAGIMYAFKCTGYKDGYISKLEWMGNDPTRTGPVQDSDWFKLVMNDYLYANEFTVIPNMNYTTIIKAVEARRVDNALETYIKNQQNASLCEKNETVRSFVSF